MAGGKEPKLGVDPRSQRSSATDPGRLLTLTGTHVRGGVDGSGLKRDVLCGSCASCEHTEGDNCTVLQPSGLE